MADSLRELQRRFQAYILGQSEQFEKDIVSTEEALAEHRLATYYNAYRLRLLECLEEDYKSLYQEMGEEDFESLVIGYISAHPSHYYSVRWVGKQLPAYLAETQGQGFLSELALFEWAQGLAFDAEDSNSLFGLEQMAEIAPESWPQLTITFHPSVAILDLQWNIPPYWVALEQGEAAPEKTQNEVPIPWLLWRKEFDPHWRSLAVAEAWCVMAAMRGENFANLCEGLLEWVGEDAVAQTAAGFLRQWIHDGLVVQVTAGY